MGQLARPAVCFGPPPAPDGRRRLNEATSHGTGGAIHYRGDRRLPVKNRDALSEDKGKTLEVEEWLLLNASSDMVTEAVGRALVEFDRAAQSS